MNEKMTTEEFLKKYADNLLQGLIDGNISYSYLTIECQFCPLRAQCEKDEKEGRNEYITCADYFKMNLSDGKAFRAR